jgi:Zn-dependent protease
LVNGTDLMRAVIGLVPMILSLSVHEWAHAWSANKLGDDTAAREGRLTLNPAAHIDPFGTILLPLLLSLQGWPGFGWARPVPVNPTRFRRDVSMGRGMAITAAAGPISNLVLALAATIVLGLLYRFDLSPRIAHEALVRIMALNVGLALFNLIPLPPLDGSRVVAWLIPTRYRDFWHSVERAAPMLLIVVFMFGGRVIAGPFQIVVNLLFRIVNAIA